MRGKLIGLVCALLSACSLAPAFAQLSFEQQGNAAGFVRPTGQPYPYDWMHADLNEDGCPDLVHVAHGMTPSTSFVRLGDCAGGFGPNLYQALDSALNGVATQLGWRIDAADIDGDGHHDLWLGGWTRNHICYGDGTGSGWSCTYVSSASGPRRIGDANGDGLLDYMDSDSRWRINDGTRTAGSWPTVTNLFSLAGPDVIDLDHDGWPDYLDLVSDRIYRGNAGGTYTYQAIGTDARGYVLEDVTGDGCDDIGIMSGTYWYRSNKSWMIQQGPGCSGAFAFVAAADMAWYPGFEFERADLDNDGDLDIVQTQSIEYGNCAAQWCGPFHVYDGTGGALLSHGISWAAAYYQMTAAVDYDQDGRIDLPAVNGTSQAETSWGVSLFRNLTNNANHWLKVRLPALSAPFGVPAEVWTLDVGTGAVISRAVVRSGYHLPAARYHLGVGPRSTVRVRVVWPDATVTEVVVATDGIVDVVAGGEPPPPPPPPPADTTPPVVSLQQAVFTAAASDDVGISHVSWLLDGGLVGTSEAAPYTFALPLSLAPGPHTLVARAWDAAGNHADATMALEAP